jgi:tRNA(Ile)-lysidine synthase
MNPPSRLSTELAAFFRSLGAPAPSVLACVSGGADSVALVHLLCEFRAELGIGRLGVAHVNHCLRGAESDGDEAFVRGVAEGLGLEFFCTRLDAPTPAGDNGDANNNAVDTAIDDKDAGDDVSAAATSKDTGLEAWARRERYRFFGGVMRASGFGFAATAHTADDQAETVLMRLARGAGVRGARGILPVRADGVIRPLLGVERRELAEWLSARGIAHRVDSSNADARFRRNFVRAEVVPLIASREPGAARNIASFASDAARAWGVVEREAGKWAAAHVTKVNEGAFHVDKAGLADTLLAPEALLVLFGEYGIPASRLHIGRVMESSGLSSGEYLLPGGWRFYPREDRVCFVQMQKNDNMEGTKPMIMEGTRPLRGQPYPTL